MNKGFNFKFKGYAFAIALHGTTRTTLILHYGLKLVVPNMHKFSQFVNYMVSLIK